VAEIFWPAGVPDDPLKFPTWEPIDNGLYFSTTSGNDRMAENNFGVAINMLADYPMTDYQFNGLWLPWWFARKINGGCSMGTSAFWLRDPIQRMPYVRKPFRWTRQQGQNMKPTRDGLSWIVNLPLKRLPV
jgi:hypothetical protein